MKIHIALCSSVILFFQISLVAHSLKHEPNPVPVSFKPLPMMSTEIDTATTQPTELLKLPDIFVQDRSKVAHFLESSCLGIIVTTYDNVKELAHWALHCSRPSLEIMPKEYFESHKALKKLIKKINKTRLLDIHNLDELHTYFFLNLQDDETKDMSVFGSFCNFSHQILQSAKKESKKLAKILKRLQKKPVKPEIISKIEELLTIYKTIALRMARMLAITLQSPLTTKGKDTTNIFPEFKEENLTQAHKHKLQKPQA